MTTEITGEEAAHIARLCRLELSPEELKRFSSQLSDVLRHVETIRRLDTDAVAPMTHPIVLANVLRDDLVVASLPRNEVLAEAPETEDDRFRVPRILGEAP